MKTFNENSEKIPYEKSPISIKKQVENLKSRGLIIDDENIKNGDGSGFLLVFSRGQGG